MPTDEQALAVPVSRRARSRELLERVHRSYCKPGELTPGVVFLPEVNAPGGHRRADALALHLTKARPWIDGIEIKVSRADWLRELDQHTKADGWFPNTHRWWIAVPDASIVDTSELPNGWGLMCPDPRSDRRMKPLMKPEVRTPQLDYAAVVEVLKQLDNQRARQVAKQADEQVRRERDKLRAEHDQQLRQRQAHPAPTEAQRDRDTVRALITATGLTGHTIQHRLGDPHTAQLVSAVLNGLAPGSTDGPVLAELQRAARRHESISAALTNAIDALTDSCHQRTA